MVVQLGLELVLIRTPYPELQEVHQEHGNSVSFWTFAPLLNPRS